MKPQPKYKIGDWVIRRSMVVPKYVMGRVIGISTLIDGEDRICPYYSLKTKTWVIGAVERNLTLAYDLNAMKEFLK